MNKTLPRIFHKIFLLILTSGLAACNLPRAVNTPTAFPTLALPELSTSTPPEMVTSSPGLAPTATTALATPIVITATPGFSASATAPQPTPKPTSTTVAACTNKATFVKDVTIPDGTAISPGKSFTKTWRVRNDGTCTWGPEGDGLFALAFAGGSRLGGPSQVKLPDNVEPGNTLTVSVDLTAPTTPGSYTSQWEFKLTDGSTIGLGADQSAPLTAEIRVTGSLTRVFFDTGATSAEIDGKVNANESKEYVLNALKGQVLIAEISSEDPGSVSLMDLNGKPLPSTVVSDDGTFAWSLLPASQDYIVEVTAGSHTMDYSLTITIPSRITFKQGATSATVKGVVTTLNTVSYVLRAMKNQTMTVKVSSSHGTLVLNIYGLDDEDTLVSASANKSSWSGKLPANQDYVVEVVPHIGAATFTLDITIK